MFIVIKKRFVPKLIHSLSRTVKTRVSYNTDYLVWSPTTPGIWELQSDGKSQRLSHEDAVVMPNIIHLGK